MISPFKINLGLHIINKREDGYHNLETCMYPIIKGDTVEITSSISGKLEFFESGILANCSADSNLAIKAFKLLESEFNLPAVAIKLHKVLPFGAGIGGGSANAAAVLLETNKFFQLGLQNSQLEEIASKLGADCPIFIQNKPQYCIGTGTEFKAIALPDLSSYQIMVIHPGFGISTAEAYSSITPNSDRVELSNILTLPISEWQENLINDFQAPMEERYPIIREIKEWMLEQGALYSAMSGSGSAVFGIFNTIPSEIPEFSEGQTVIC